MTQEQIRQRFSPPPYHISIHLGQADDATLRRLLCRYDLPVDNGIFTQRLSGAEVDVKLYRCPANLIPANLPPRKFVVCVASGGGLTQSILVAPLPGGKVYDMWEGPQEGWDSADLIIKSPLHPTIMRSDSDLFTENGEGQPGRPDGDPASATTFETTVNSEWEHDADDHEQVYSGSFRNPERDDNQLQPVMTRVVSNQVRDKSLNADTATDSDTLVVSTATHEPLSIVLRNGLATAPEHIVKQLQQADTETMRALLRIDPRTIHTTRLGSSITYVISGSSTHLSVKGYYVPNDLVPAELRKRARLVLVASGHGLAYPVILAQSDESKSLRVWTAATGYEYGRRVQKHFAPGHAVKKRSRSVTSDDDSDASFEDYDNVEPIVGGHSMLFSKRPRTSVDYARMPEIEIDEAGLSKRKSPRETRNLGPNAAAATTKHNISDQSFYPSRPSLEPTGQLMTPTPSLNSTKTSSQVQSTGETRARTTICFARASSDVSLKFPLGVVDSIQKFFKLAEIAHTIRAGQDTAALSAQIPGVEEAVELVLFAGYGFDELLEKIDNSSYWDYAGKNGECMVEVREFGQDA